MANVAFSGGRPRLLALMTVRHRAKVARHRTAGGESSARSIAGPGLSSDGVKRQRAEVRFDDVAGCLRTPAGGSSRQTILLVEGDGVRSRLLSPRDAASLMGLPATYVLPTRYNDAYRLAGDGVAVPVVGTSPTTSSSRCFARTRGRPLCRARRGYLGNGRRRRRDGDVTDPHSKG